MSNVFREIENRQNSLKLNDIDNAVVVGVGGIGSWVALNLGLSGGVDKLTLIDPDKIESSNLNRTPFRLADIGGFKVEALQYLILERRAANITVFPEKTNDVLNSWLDKEFRHQPSSENVIIDCRDDIFKDLYHLPAKYYKLGYDGLEITVDGDPKNTPVWGNNQGYRVIPSFICPAQLIANLVVNDILIPQAGNVDDRGYKCDDAGRLNDVVTFNSSHLLKFITKEFSRS